MSWHLQGQDRISSSGHMRPRLSTGSNLAPSKGHPGSISLAGRNHEAVASQWSQRLGRGSLIVAVNITPSGSRPPLAVTSGMPIGYKWKQCFRQGVGGNYKRFYMRPVVIYTVALWLGNHKQQEAAR